MLQGWNNLAGNARKLKLLSASSIPFPGPDTVPALGLREAVWGGREGRRDRVEGGLAAAVQPSRLHHPTLCPAAAVGGQDQRNPPGLPDPLPRAALRRNEGLHAARHQQPRGQVGGAHL